VDGFDFRMEIPKIRGGPILWKFIANMQDKLRCERSVNMPMRADPELAGQFSLNSSNASIWIIKIPFVSSKKIPLRSSIVPMDESSALLCPFRGILTNTPFHLLKVNIKCLARFHNCRVVFRTGF
jgi:hypothetical protein